MRQLLFAALFLFSLEGIASAFVSQRRGGAGQGFFKPGVVAAASPGSVETTTGAVARIDFEEPSGTAVAESIQGLTGKLATSHSLTDMHLSTGVNNTNQVKLFSSSGNVTFAANSTAFSPHAGEGGRMTILFVINPQTLGADRYYIDKMQDTGSDYEYRIYWSNGGTCGSGGPTLAANFHSAVGAGIGCAGMTAQGDFAAGKSTAVAVVYDENAAEKVTIWIGNRKPSQTHDNTAGLATAANSPFYLGRNAGTADNSALYADATMDMIRVLPYTASKQTIDNYLGDITILSKMKQDQHFKRWWSYRSPFGLDASANSVAEYEQKHSPWKMIGQKILASPMPSVMVLVK